MAIRDAVQPGDIPPSDDTSDVPLDLAAAAFELNIVKADTEAVGPDLADPPVVIEVDIPKSYAPSNPANFGPAGPNC